MHSVWGKCFGCIEVKPFPLKVSHLVGKFHFYRVARIMQRVFEVLFHNYRDALKLYVTCSAHIYREVVIARMSDAVNSERQ